jgi:NADH pyrophosphatase NudC (nudix superfamily)
MTHQTLIASLATVASATLMAIAGVEKSLLEWRRHRRICPSCGRHLQQGGSCACSRR